MTYQTTVIADSPYIYLPFTNNSLANQGGSKTGMTQTSSGATFGTSDTIKGADLILSGNTSYVQYSVSTENLFNSSYTIEVWMKAGVQASYANIVHREEANNKIAFRIDAPGTTYANKITMEYRGGSGVSKVIVGPVVTDNLWHHVVVTDDRTNVTMYVDGVQVAQNTSNTACTFTTINWRLGAYGTGAGNENYAGALDEVALYKTVLTSTQVRNHYQAGFIGNTTVIPDGPMTMTASIPAPVVIGSTNVTVNAPAATMDLSAPSSVTTETNSNLSVPAMTATLSAPDAVSRIDKTVVVPAMTLGTVSMPETITVALGIAYGSTSDGDGSGFGPNIDIFNNSGHGWFRTGTITPPNGMQIQSAVLRLNVFSQGSGNTATVSIRQLLTDWAQDLAGVGSAGGPTFSATSLGTISIPNNGINTWYELDVTSLVQSWINGTASNYGIGIVGTGGQTSSAPTIFYSHKAGTPHPELAPQIVVTYVAAPQQDVTVTAPVATMSLSAPAPKFTLILPVPPMTLDLFMGDVFVGSTTDAVIAAPVFTSYLTFVGGKTNNPDVTVVVSPMEAGTLSSPDPTVGLQYPIYVNAEPMTLALEMEENVGIDLVTNRIIPVANAMAMNIRMVGIYNELADRYLQTIPTTVDADDIWYRMNETAGATRATDFIAADTNWKQDGYYFGAPTFTLSDGPELRPAVHFNGSTDYFIVGPYNRTNLYTDSDNDVTTDMSVTIEFSIRTTQTDGVVFTGGGAQSYAAASQSASAGVTDRPALNGNEVRLVGGQLTLFNGSGKSVKVRQNVADGEWHHVIIAIPNVANQNETHYDNELPAYVAIDGKPILVRYSTFLGDSKSRGGYWLPWSFMGRATPKFTVNGKSPVASTQVAGYLAGDLSNIVVRLNSYIPLLEAESIYYDWSLATIVDADPMILNVSTVAPTKATGNTKKMLAVYGLPWGYDAVNGNPLFNYMSNLSGMVIQNLSNIGETRVNADRASFGQGSVVFQRPKAFMMEGYMVYPVSIVGDNTINGVTSVAGVLNPDAETGYNGNFIDDSTGLPRFINLQEDLLVDVTDYDIVTVVNYPWATPDSNAPEPAVAGGVVQKDLGLSDTEWAQARDALRDSILEAAYDGVNLWIGEYHMAQHLGFIQGYDIHDAGNFDSVGNNRRAADLDVLYNPTGNNAGFLNAGNGDYYSYPQANFNRRIVGLEEDLTDVPSNEYGDWIEAWNVDEWKPYGSMLAWNIQHRPNGLQIGDQFPMSMLPLNSKWITFGADHAHPATWNQYKRIKVISARPEGIVGKVIAREVVSYYGRNGVLVDNPFKNNAVTIIAERGSVVRGRATAGRVFMEFMETDIYPSWIPEQTDKKSWQGSHHEPQITFWDFDTRRDKEVKIETARSTISLTQGGTFTLNTAIQNYYSYTEAGRTYNKRVSMHARGLNWLANAPEIAEGDVIVYADSMVSSLAVPAPTFERTASTTVEIIGTMRLDLEVRQPSNFSDGSVEVNALPMILDLKMNGLGVLAQVPPMTMTLVSVSPSIEADMETVTVYLDGDRNITLFLKEDN